MTAEEIPAQTSSRRKIIPENPQQMLGSLPQSAVRYGTMGC